MVHILLVKQPVLIKVDYYLPDYKLILNEFLWQVDDVWPTIPRVHKFLNYWKEHIEAPINQVYVANSNRQWRTVESLNNI
jgi:uncharacterized protein Usg